MSTSMSSTPPTPPLRSPWSFEKSVRPELRRNLGSGQEVAGGLEHSKEVLEKYWSPPEQIPC